MRKPARLLFGGVTYTCEPGETVLEALLRQQAVIPHDCRKQTCLSCLMRSLDGTPPPASQINLKDTIKVQNYFLACACRPARDMEIALPSDTLKHEVSVTATELTRLNGHILRLTLEGSTLLDYRGGQSVILLNHDKIGKPFSIASPSSDRFNNRLEVHVERINGCCFCEWLHDHLRKGDVLRVFGPNGQMFYLPHDPRQPLVLAGWHGGLGGLIGILQDIFEQQHKGPVYLFHGARNQYHLYLVEEIREIQTYYPNFQYVPCIAEGPVPNGCTAGEVHEIIRRMLPKLSGWQLFLSGPRVFVDRLRRQAYLDGALIRDILYEVSAV